MSTLERFNTRMQEVEARISELKDKATDLTQREKQTETRILKSDDTLRDL